MDKNKSRTDMLAAGRKKLQQFRQKKDGKTSGSHGKSSKKAPKSEPDNEVSTSAAEPQDSVHIPEPEVGTENIDTNASHADLSVPQSIHDYVSSESSAPTVDATAEQDQRDSIGDVMRETADGSEIGEAVVSNEGERPMTIDSDIERVTPLRAFEVSDSAAKESMHVTGSLLAHLSAPLSTDTMNHATKSVDGEDKRKLLSSDQDLSDALLTHAREVQVTELGAMQEADSSGLNQMDSISAIEVKELDLSKFTEIPKTAENDTEVGVGVSMTKSTCEAEPPGVSLVVGNELGEVSSTVGMIADSTSSVDVVVSDQLRENLASDVEQTETQCPSDDSRKYMEVAVQPEEVKVMGSHIRDGSSNETLEEKMLKSSGAMNAISEAEGHSISLLQLAGLLKALDEDDFRFLFKSKESPINSRLEGFGSLSDYNYFEVLESYKEQIYLSNITKDFSTMQLMEQSKLQGVFDYQCHQLNDKISLLSASHVEASQTNKRLSEELQHYLSELQDVNSEREELRHQLQTATTELADFSVRVHELQNELESTWGDASSKSTELAHCKNLVDSFQLENSRLSGNLSSAMEEWKKVEQELTKCKDLVVDVHTENGQLKESLAFVTDERNKLKAAKEDITSENENMLSQLADCNRSVEAVQAEKANAIHALALMTDDVKKLGEENNYYARESDRLRSESAYCQSLVKTLQSENANLMEGLSLVTSDRCKLEEVKENLTGEIKGLSSNLHVHQELLSVSQAEYLQLEADLKEMKLQVDQLIEENLFLGSSLDIHQGKIREIRNMQIQLADESLESSNQIESRDLYEESHQSSHKLDAEFSSPLLEGKALTDDYEEEEAIKELGQNVYSDIPGFVDLNGRYKEAGKIIVELEKTIREMHSHSVSLSRSISKVSAPGVSKLIQAFETKTRHEDGDAEQNILTDLSIDDPFTSSKELTKKLRTLLKDLRVDSVNASEVLKGERNDKEAANIAYNELKIRYEGIHQHTDQLEAKNIELLIQFESVKQYIYNVEDKKSELLGLYATLQQENISLKLENTEAGKKLNDFHARIDELNGQLGEFQHRLEEGASLICSRIKNLNNEVAKIFEAACIKYEAISNSYTAVIEQMNHLRGENELAILALNKIYESLRELVISSHVSLQQGELNLQNDELDYLEISKYEDLIELLGTFLRETVLLKYENTKLNNELRSSNIDVEELKARCLDFNVVLKLVENVEAVVTCESLNIDLDKPPLSRLSSSVGFLLQRYIETDDRVHLMSEELASMVSEASKLRDKVTQLDSLILSQKNEIDDFIESLRQAEEALVVNRAELKEKTLELEQSEQRVSSIREKLSIAVGKGKGLIVQRDNLKQSLTEISAKLERSSQELQLKDARLHETEEKLKMYSEAGERVEALESELSYIRNSAAALRESFLLKDSVIQRIEEILEDLELPDNFHSRDIIEKVDWLARSVCGNSMPQVDWDQKSSAEGESYADADFVAMDGWKEDTQPNSNSDDDLRRKYQELEGKFYRLAEQNEMLEQSLMERNNLVQRWEEVLGMINMSTQVRSMEPEDRIAWLGNELSEVHQYATDLQQKIDNLENHCGTLTSDLEQSQIKLSEIETALEMATHDKGHLSKSLETLIVDHEKISDRAAQFELANDKLQKELLCLQEKLAEKRYHEQQVERIESGIVRLQGLVSNALQDPTEALVSGASSIECLEGLLIQLVDKYTSLCSEEPLHIDATVGKDKNREILDAENSEVLFLKKELESALSDVMHLTEEANVHVETRRSLCSEVEALNRKMEELQELLTQEEKKAGSAREKLNVAVRKGKSLVQQRDSLKQTIEELNTEIALLKNVISEKENIVSQSEQKIKDLSAHSERVVVLESENLSLKDHLTETEHLLNERDQNLGMIWDTVTEIDIGGDHGSYNDPVLKLKQLGKRCSELKAAVDSSEKESKKSRKAAALLVEELNEVQERNDSLQEELAKSISELLALSKEKDMAHAAKLDALSRLEKLSFTYSEVKRDEYAALVALKSVVHKFNGSFHEVNNLLADVLLKDLDFWHNLESCLELCLKPNGATNVTGLPLVNIHGDVSNHSDRKGNFVGEDFDSCIKKQEYHDGSEVAEICRDVGYDLQGFITDIYSLKEKLQKHSLTLHEKSRKLSTSLQSVSTKLTSQTESLEALKNDSASFDSIRKEKDRENVVLCKSIALLYEACAASIMEIENCKPHLFGEDSNVGGLGRTLKSIAAAAVSGQLVLGGPTLVSSQEQIKTLADGLSLLVKKLISMEAEILDGGHKEMKATIENLHRELQEKDMQRDGICMELTSQIRGAEAAATKYSNDYQSAKNHVHDLEKCMEGLEEECASLKQRVNELQDKEAASVELQEKVRSLTETVAAKDQEIETIMQALDEEEMQMEELVNKISELEKVVQQRDIDLENLEASRGKAMKKLSITVSRFDELHNLSASLLAEVEKLQSQLQDRDSEISFLRQEVTRCTSDVLTASQTNSNTNSDELHGLLTWLGEVISRDIVHDFQLDREGIQIHDFIEILQNQITSIVTELQDLRTIARSKDAHIEMERGRVEELTRKRDTLEDSLRQKETQLKFMKNARVSGEEGSMSPEIVEAEPAVNQWNVPATSITSKVRSLRKANNDQVAISIDTDLDNNRLEDEDDDKVHGFKSLTTSRIVPRFTRPVSDMIDGLWVSCDRALMRQPALRLGIIIYWAVLHALFASFAV